jgi:hypothetical protein
MLILVASPGCSEDGTKGAFDRSSIDDAVAGYAADKVSDATTVIGIEDGQTVRGNFKDHGLVGFEFSGQGGSNVQIQLNALSSGSTPWRFSTDPKIAMAATHSRLRAVTTRRA